MKLYLVMIERTMMVLADCETAAEDYALSAEQEETVLCDPDLVDAQEVIAKGMIPIEWVKSIPYGENPEDLTCEAIMELIDRAKPDPNQQKLGL